MKQNGFSQSAGQKQQRGEFGDVEGQDVSGAVRLEPLRLLKAQAECDVEQRRQRDHAQARPNRDGELKTKMHHQDARDLTKNGQPAQAHQRIEPHVARPMSCSWQTKHAANVAIAEG